MGRHEDSRVKLPAIIHLTRLGYTYLSLKNLKKDVDYDQETNIFFCQFYDGINQINDIKLNKNEAYRLIEEISIVLENNDLGKSFFELLQSGINGYRLIDFETPENNLFNIVTELPYENAENCFRPDITILINGMPLSFIEVKRQNNKDGILSERERMTQRFSNPIFKKFVNITQFTVFSNNNEYDDNDIEPIQGAFYAAPAYGKMFFSKFREQKEAVLGELITDLDIEIEKFILKDNNLISIKGTPEYQSSIRFDTPTNRILTSLYSIRRIIFLIHYGLCYRATTDKAGIFKIEKHIMRYPQLFATLSISDMLDRGGKKGVIWHTQGSGKTALAYLNVKYLKDYYRNQGKIAKFYFIVDRIDLAEQAKSEFQNRGLKVITVSSKEQFKNSISYVSEEGKTGETTITVVNIQKFSSESVAKPTDYDVNVQRIYFLDEAHRSYNPKGSFLANLIGSDRDSVIIALTGTPLIGKGAKREFDISFNTKDVFGNYIHKYYYNQSIADGYTLKLIREEIETTYRKRMVNTLEHLEVQLGSIDPRELYAHPKFVEDMLGYITDDFIKGKNYLDDSIGAMIVCDSAKQAREIDRQLENYKAISHALVLHDIGSKTDRRRIQSDFKKGLIDILVVYNMLLTGFDAPRLKKQYLTRVIKEHNLLQTLTRVNRPYKDFRYGFVVDFVNIKDEFDKTNKAYFNELQEELGDEAENYSNLFKSVEEIDKELQDIKNQLFLYDSDNIVEFIKQISSVDDKQQLLKLKQALENYKSLQNLIRLFGYDELISQFNIKKAMEMLSEIVNRINIINLKQSFNDMQDMSGVLSIALDQIEFNFRKIDEKELVIADAFKNQLERTRVEIVEKNLDPKDPEYILLLEELKRIFKQKNIEELNGDEMQDLIEKLESLRKKAEKRNHKDQLLVEKYRGDIKFMRTHKRLKGRPNLWRDDIEIYSILMDVKEKADRVVENNERILDNHAYFVKQLQPFILMACEKNNVDINPEQIIFIDNCISQEYFSERAWMS